MLNYFKESDNDKHPNKPLRSTYIEFQELKPSFRKMEKNVIPLIDSHTHIQEHSEIDQENIVSRALLSNVRILVAAGTTIKDSEKSIGLSNRYPNVFSGVGVHPTELTSTFSETEIKNLKKLANHKKVICLSEIGIDYQDNSPDKSLQKIAFDQQIKLAKRLNLPVVFHIRENKDEFNAFNARDAALEILKENVGIMGIAHYFQGNWTFAKRLLDLGLYLSFAKPLLRMKELEETAIKVPDDMFVVETDSYPQPFKKVRSKWTEPYQLPTIVKKISELRRRDVQTISQLTTNNALHIFNKHRFLIEKQLNDT